MQAPPADAISSADWVQLGDIARAQVQAALLSGKVRPKDAAVIAAMADRNAALDDSVASLRAALSVLASRTP